MSGGPGVTGHEIKTNLKLGFLQDVPLGLDWRFVDIMERIERLEQYVTLPSMKVGARMIGNTTIIAPLEGMLRPQAINPFPNREFYRSMGHEGLPQRFEAQHKQLCSNLGFYYFSIGNEEFYLYDSKDGLHLSVPER